MGKDEEILERRRELAQRVFMGQDKKEVFEEVAKEHGVEMHTVRCDWSNRKKWLRKVFDIDCDEEVVEMILSEQRFIRNKYMEIFKDAKSNGTKVGCLNAIRETNEQMIEFMQELGVLEKQAEKMEIEGEIEMTSLAKMAEEWLDAEKQE